MGYIYRISNTVNGKVYIGQTINDPEIRWNSHKKNIKNKSINRPLVDAMRVLGIDKFKMDVIIVCFDESMDYIEMEQIKRYNSLHPNGYNYTEGGHFHNRPSEELRKKLSMSCKKRFEREGERDKNREAQRLAFSNPELRQKMATARAKLLNSDAGTVWKDCHSKKINAFYKTEEGKEAKKKASDKKKEFFKSEDGILQRKKHSDILKLRSTTEEGKKSIKQMSDTKKAFFATEEGKQMMKLIQDKRKKTLDDKKKYILPKFYRCDICEYDAPNNGKLQRHISSKKHLNNITNIIQNNDM
jgi:hypothetical protein